MKWSKLLCTTRFGADHNPPTSSENSSPFEVDVNRILFSDAFRRLSRKTQVHPLAGNDHVHNRLTHSLEAAQVGWTLGKELGYKIKEELPEGASPFDLAAILQAACLAHDIGNPAFGHAGEEALSSWFALNGDQFCGSLPDPYKTDLKSFEGNAQGFRMLTQTENYLFDGGLRLTYATLGTFHKYPWSHRSRTEKKKFGAYISEEEKLDKISDELGLIEKGNGCYWSKHPLAYLLEAADDICYATIDLIDAVELKMFSFEKAENFMLSLFNEGERNDIRNDLDSTIADRDNLSRLRERVLKRMVSGTINEFMNKYECIMHGEQDEPILTDRTKEGKFIKEAKELAKTYVYSDDTKIQVELGSYATFESLLNSFCPAVIEASESQIKSDSLKGGEDLKWKSKQILKLLGSHSPLRDRNDPVPLPHDQYKYECLRRVIDYVSGMTDNYATHIAKQLQGMAFTGMQRP
jgi:dGTPase